MLDFKTFVMIIIFTMLGNFEPKICTNHSGTNEFFIFDVTFRITKSIFIFQVEILLLLSKPKV